MRMYTKGKGKTLYQTNMSHIFKSPIPAFIRIRTHTRTHSVYLKSVRIIIQIRLINSKI